MDDPGWGDYVPVSGNEEPAAGRGPGKRSGGGPLESIGGPWVLGAAILVVIVGVGVALKLSSGSGKKAVAATSVTTTPATTTPVTTSQVTTTPITTSTAATTTTTATTTALKAKPKVATGVPIATYDRQADAICSKYNPKMDQANTDNSIPEFGEYLAAEWLGITKLKHPTTASDAAEMRKAIVDAEKALVYLAKNGDNPSAAQLSQANNFLIAAHTIEGALGMKVCNFGH
jgi:hypothetical protein